MCSYLRQVVMVLKRCKIYSLLLWFALKISINLELVLISDKRWYIRGLWKCDMQYCANSIKRSREVKVKLLKLSLLITIKNLSPPILNSQNEYIVFFHFGHQNITYKINLEKFYIYFTIAKKAECKTVIAI